MKKNEKGITLITLAITIIILLILAGITLGTIRKDDGVLKQAQENKTQAERESIIEKIEADLYNEKVKIGKIPSKEKLIEIINKSYGTIHDESFTTKQGNYTIELTEIIGWQNSEEES